MNLIPQDLLTRIEFKPSDIRFWINDPSFEKNTNLIFQFKNNNFSTVRYLKRIRKENKWWKICRRKKHLWHSKIQYNPIIL